jgi:intraflagellar transport protein 81
VSGYHDTQEELEKVSTVKSELDEQKGKTLEDISDLVNKIYFVFHKKRERYIFQGSRERCPSM